MERQRRLIIHVGQSKAGSTSIQNFLDTQREALLAKGFIFPKAGLFRKNPFDQKRTSGHLALMRDLQGEIGQEFEDEISAFPDHTVILSAENLFSNSSEDLSGGIGSYFETWRIEIIVVLRPQFDWLRSRYVEDVMSGFIRRVSTFSKFAKDTFEGGSLNYACRLETMKAQLRAASIKAIALDSEDDALIPRFLQVAQVPLTDMHSAVKIYDNRREEQFFCVEAKRRLNQMTTSMKGRQQLELENALLKAAHAMAHEHDVSVKIGLGIIPLNTQQRAVLLEENRTLNRIGVLDEQLDLGSEWPTCEKLDIDFESAVENLFWLGVEKATEVAARSDQDNRIDRPPLCFDASELATLKDLFALHPISFHFSSPETALLAAAGQNRLVKLFCSTELVSYAKVKEFDLLELPSNPVALPLSMSDDVSLRRSLSKAVLTQPDLVVISVEVGEHVIQAILEEIDPHRLAIWGKGTMVLPKEAMQGFAVRRVGCVMILEKRRHHSILEANTLGLQN